MTKEEVIKTREETAEANEEYFNYVNPGLWDEHTTIVIIKRYRHIVKFDENEGEEELSRCNYCGGVFLYKNKFIPEISRCADCGLTDASTEGWELLIPDEIPPDEHKRNAKE